MAFTPDPLLGFVRSLAASRNDFFSYVHFQRIFEVSAAPDVLTLYICIPNHAPISLCRTEELVGDVFGAIPVPLEDGRLSILSGDAGQLENWQNASTTRVAEDAEGARVALFWNERVSDLGLDMEALGGLVKQGIGSHEPVVSRTSRFKDRLSYARSMRPWSEVRDEILAIRAAAHRRQPFEERWRIDHMEQGDGFVVLRAGEGGVLFALKLSD